MRQKESRPKVDAFRNWAEKQLTRIPGKSDLAKAFRYGLSRWPAFTQFLEDGRVAIDNNPATLLSLQSPATCTLSRLSLTHSAALTVRCSPASTPPSLMSTCLHALALSLSRSKGSTRSPAPRARLSPSRQLKRLLLM